MARTVADRFGASHPVLPDIGRPVMAKADVRTPDIDWNVAIGGAIQDAVKDARLSNKEAAAKVNVDDAEFGKWLSGTRRPQFDRLFAVPVLRRPLAIALAALAGDEVEVETVVRIRRRVAA